MNLDQVVLHEIRLGSYHGSSRLGIRNRRPSINLFPETPSTTRFLLLASLLDFQDTGGFVQTSVLHQALKVFPSRLE